MSYIEQVDGGKLGDVLMHTVGSQEITKNVLYATAYGVSSTYKLEEEATRKFTFNTDVKLMGVGTRPEDDLYDVYISYFEPGNEL